MSRVLSLSGAALPARIMPARAGNDLGHWEPEDIADLNDRILQDLDSRWDDTFGPHRKGKARISTLKYLDAATKLIRENWSDRDTIVVKEPRVNLLLELWSQALKDEGYRPAYVIMTRHPLEVAESLKKRNGLTRNQSLILWAKYMLAAEFGTRDDPRLFVRYQDLLTDPEEVLDRIEASLDVVLPRRSWLASTEIDQFLTADARHYNAAGKSVRKTLPAIQDYFEYIESAAMGAPANEDASAALRDWLSSLEQAVGPILASVESSLRAAQKSLETQSSMVTELNDALAEARQTLESRVREIEADRAYERASLETELDEARAQISAIADLESEARKALEDRLQEIEADRAFERESLTHSLEAARSELVSVTASEAETRRLLEEEIRGSQMAAAARTELESRLAELSDELATAAEARTTLEAELAQARSDSKTVAAASAELESRLAELSDELATAAEARATLEAELAQAQSDSKTVAAARAELESRLAELSDELATAAEARTTLEAELAQARSDSKTVAAASAELESRLAELSDELATAAEARAALEAELAQARSDSKTVAHEKADLESKLAGLTDELARAVTARAEADTALSRVRSESLTTIANIREASHSEIHAALAAEREATIALAKAKADFSLGEAALRTRVAERVEEVMRLRNEATAQNLAFETVERELRDQLFRSHATHQSALQKATDLELALKDSIEALTRLEAEHRLDIAEREEEAMRLRNEATAQNLAFAKVERELREQLVHSDEARQNALQKAVDLELALKDSIEALTGLEAQHRRDIAERDMQRAQSAQLAKALSQAIANRKRSNRSSFGVTRWAAFKRPLRRN